jgi:hypothetical protein
MSNQTGWTTFRPSHSGPGNVAKRGPDMYNFTKGSGNSIEVQAKGSTIWSSITKSIALASWKIGKKNIITSSVKYFQ